MTKKLVIQSLHAVNLYISYTVKELWSLILPLDNYAFV